MRFRAWPTLRNLGAGIVCGTWLLACPAFAAETMDTYTAFADRVIAAEKPLEKVATWKGLYGYPAFDALASDAGAHVDDCIQFLADPNHTGLQKLFATYAMYKTPLRDYLDFVRKLAAAHDRDRGSRLIIVAIVPHPSYVPSNPIFDNYRKPEVQQLLKDIAARPGWDYDDELEFAFVRNGGDIWYKMRTDPSFSWFRR